MSVTKRSSKILSYNEQDDDDDDFIPIVDKNRINKSSKQPEKKSEQAIIENTNIQSTVSTDDSKVSDVHDQDENLSPKNKRIKHNEEENEETITSKSDQPNSSSEFSVLPKRNSSVPLGFPTSKINIPSPHVSRVGLSRKSLTIKPLHPNLSSRIIIPE